MVNSDQTIKDTKEYKRKKRANKSGVMMWDV